MFVNPSFTLQMMLTTLGILMMSLNTMTKKKSVLLVGTKINDTCFKTLQKDTYTNII